MTSPAAVRPPIASLSESLRISPLRTFVWSVRREFWQHRSLLWAPAIAAGIVLVGYLISLVFFPERLGGLASINHRSRPDALEMPFHLVASVLMLVTMAASAFYCVEAFQSERRDRSILFWNSLPVSDWTTVLARAVIPILLMPLLAFAVTFVVHLLMFAASSATLLARGMNPSLIWTTAAFARMSLLLLYHLVTVHGLWQAPLYAWLLLISAWARRAALLWAVLPPLAIGVFERLVFGTTYLLKAVDYRMGAGLEALTLPDRFPMDPSTHLTPLRYFSSFGFWSGLAITAVCLGIAVHLRRSRGAN